MKTHVVHCNANTQFCVPTHKILTQLVRIPKPRRVACNCSVSHMRELLLIPMRHRVEVLHWQRTVEHEVAFHQWHTPRRAVPSWLPRRCQVCRRAHAGNRFRHCGDPEWWWIEATWWLQRRLRSWWWLPVRRRRQRSRV